MIERRRSRTLAAWAVVAVSAGAAVFGLRVVARPLGSEVDELAEMPRSPGIEQTYGILVRRVSVTAGGGIVEVRYQLLDADRADVLHQDDVEYGEEFPRILDGDVVLDTPTFHHHGGELVTGRELSILYPNVGGEVRAGDVVTIEIGDEQLTDVPVG